MKSVVQKAKRTPKRQRQQKESGQIITGMEGDSTAIHSNVAGTQNVQEMHQDFRNIHIGDIYNINYVGGTHETDWHCNPAPNQHISQVPRESFHRFGRRIRKFFRARLRRVTRGSLIFSFAHTTSEDAIDMIVKHRKVKEVFLDFVQELDPSVEDIRIEVVLRELSVSEEQTTQITETRPGGMADPEHKDEEGASRSHPQQKDDDETCHPHIQESGDNSSSLSHSPQTKDEDTCVPHPQKTEEDKTSLQQTDEDTSHQHPQKTEEDETPLQQTDEDTSHLHQTSGIKKGSRSHSSGYTSSDPSQGHSRRRRDPLLSTASHASSDSSRHWLHRLFSTASHASSDPSLKPLVKEQDSDRRASSDPSQGHSRRRRDPLLSTASHATPSQADRDLYFASKAGDLEEVKRLLSTPGVDVDCRVGGGCWTPVLAAAWRGHRDVVELLVSKGADVSLVDKYGNNTLHHACMEGDVEMVKYLLSLNVVDIDARNMWGKTAADRARIGEHQPVVELLKSRGAQ